MSTLMTRSKNLHLSPLTIQPRVRKLCNKTDESLPNQIKMLKNVVEIQKFEATETLTECYLVKFESLSSEWCCYELFSSSGNKLESVIENKVFKF